MKNQSFFEKVVNSITQTFNREKNAVEHIPVSKPYENLPQHELLDRVRENPEIILKLTHPTDAMLHTAIYERPELVLKIDKPFEGLLQTAVYHSPGLINSIEKPSDQLIITAITEKPELIPDLKVVPSEKVLLSAVTRDLDVLKYIKDPSESFKFKAVSRNGFAIKHFPNPSEALKQAAVREDSKAIKLITEPSEEVQVIAYKNDKSVKDLIYNPVKDLDIKAGWSIFDNEKKYPQNLNEIPDKVEFKLTDYSSSEHSHFLGRLNLDQEMKQELFKTGSLLLAGESLGGEIDGGHSVLSINKNGGLEFFETRGVIEGGSVNYYDTKIDINKEYCVFPEKNLELSQEQFKEMDSNGLGFGNDVRGIEINNNKKSWFDGFENDLGKDI